MIDGIGPATLFLADLGQECVALRFERQHFDDGRISPLRLHRLFQLGQTLAELFVELDVAARQLEPFGDGASPLFLAHRVGGSNELAEGPIEMREWHFRAPIFPGDTIRVRSTVLEKKPQSRGRRGIITWKAEILNQNHRVVQEGVTVTLVEGVATLALRDRPVAA